MPTTTPLFCFYAPLIIIAVCFQINISLSRQLDIGLICRSNWVETLRWNIYCSVFFDENPNVRYVYKLTELQFIVSIKY